jgi:glucosamine 6-phosphate synthetase-like amidotransferase/phosphosugar isomerase protein
MKVDHIMKVLFFAVTIIFSLLGFAFSTTLADQKATDTRLEKRIDTNSEQIQEVMKMTETLGRIDERLKNIERAVR